jgi:hypothetical protein
MKLINVSRKPFWREINFAGEGDVLVRGKSFRGVIYFVGRHGIDFCYVDWAGVMYSRTLSQTQNSLRAEVSRAIPIAHPDINDEEFAKAESAYVRSFRRLGVGV